MVEYINLVNMDMIIKLFIKERTLFTTTNTLMNKATPFNTKQRHNEMA